MDFVVLVSSMLSFDIVRVRLPLMLSVFISFSIVFCCSSSSSFDFFAFDEVILVLSSDTFKLRLFEFLLLTGKSSDKLDSVPRVSLLFDIFESFEFSSNSY